MAYDFSEVTCDVVRVVHVSADQRYAGLRAIATTCGCANSPGLIFCSRELVRRKKWSGSAAGKPSRLCSYWNRSRLGAVLASPVDCPRSSRFFLRITAEAEHRFDGSFGTEREPVQRDVPNVVGMK